MLNSDAHCEWILLERVLLDFLELIITSVLPSDMEGVVSLSRGRECDILLRAILFRDG